MLCWCFEGGDGEGQGRSYLGLSGKASQEVIRENDTCLRS